jgi:hypothetical protein
VAGSSILLTPMITLFFVDLPHYHLVTICVAVVLFSIIIMIVGKAEVSELLAITAAYTAVLGVYVGSTSPISTSS